jgi:hypothetical protein
VNVAQNARRDTDREDRQFADRFMPGTARNVHHDAPMKLDRLVIEDQRTAAVNHLIEFIGALVVVKLGIVDLDVMNLGSGTVFFLGHLNRFLA